MDAVVALIGAKASAMRANDDDARAPVVPAAHCGALGPARQCKHKRADESRGTNPELKSSGSQGVVDVKVKTHSAGPSLENLKHVLISPCKALQFP
jgi:hypothetical protein